MAAAFGAAYGVGQVVGPVSAGSALRALLSLGAKDVAVVRDGVETRVRG